MDLPTDPPPDPCGPLDTGPLSSDASAYELRRPFYFAGGRTGVLVIHGFSGTPFEIRALGEGLAARGYTVYGPRLAGHAETAQALGRSTHVDWLRSVEVALDALRARVDEVHVCGLSLGGLLTLELARLRGPTQLASITSLAAPLWLTPAVEITIALTRRLGRIPQFTLPKWAGSDVGDPSSRARNNLAQGAIGLPIPAVMSLHEFMGLVRKGLRDVAVPTLLMHSRQDHTAPFACMAEIAEHLGTRDVTSIALDRSFHVLPIDRDREAVIDAVAAHVARHGTTQHKPAQSA